MAALKTVKKVIRLHRAQADFCASKSPIKGFIGGRGSGKSFAGCFDLISRARPGRLYLVTAPTFTVLQDATFRTFVGVARELGAARPGDVKASVPPSVRLSTGAEVIFRSADQPDRLRGVNVSGCLMDEGAQVSRDVYEIVVAALREGGERGWLAVTTTPRGLSNWVADVFHQPGPDVATFHCETRMNPWLPAGFAHDVSLQYGSTLRAEQELGGRFVNVEGCEWPPEYFAGISYDELPAALPVRFRVLSLDPSKGASDKTGDYSAWADVTVDKRAVSWVYPHLKLLPSEAVEDYTVSLLQRTRYDAFIGECNGFQEVLIDNIARKCQAKGVPCPLHKKVSTENKEVRIRLGLGPLLAQRVDDAPRIRLCALSPEHRLALAQLREFPAAAHDDFPDAMNLAFDLVNYLLTGRR